MTLKWLYDPDTKRWASSPLPYVFWFVVALVFGGIARGLDRDWVSNLVILAAIGAVVGMLFWMGVRALAAIRKRPLF